MTVDNIKLIAEFMGYKFNAYPELKHQNITKPGKNDWHYATWESWEFDNHLVKNFRYDDSWDILMPVWSKCREIGIWMMTNGHDQLWFEKSKDIENAIIRDVDCEKAADRILQMIQWYKINRKND